MDDDDHPDEEDRVLRFTRRELVDFGVAWAALSLAFTFFFEGREVVVGTDVSHFWPAFAVMAGTVGVGFVAHEVAHKVIAVRFAQATVFEADYEMLFLAIVGGMAGFILAVPGVVYHRGRLTDRQHGLVALAGPVTNLFLAALFAPLLLVFNGVASLGIAINLLMAAFNMLPFGLLDGASVKQWNQSVFYGVFFSSTALGGVAFLTLF